MRKLDLKILFPYHVICFSVQHFKTQIGSKSYLSHDLTLLLKMYCYFHFPLLINKCILSCTDLVSRFRQGHKHTSHDPPTTVAANCKQLNIHKV